MNKSRLLKYFLFLVIFFNYSCEYRFTAIKPEDLDNKNIFPKVGADLLSVKGKPSPEEQNKLVVVSVHGFTATPYENKFLLDYLTKKDGNILTSRVMLGGHGTDVEDFENSTWKDWQKPLEDELDKLNLLGYKNVSVITTSTGGTLLLEILSRKNYQNLKKVVMIAPLLIFSNKTMQFVDLVKSLGIRSMPNDLEEESVGNWYRERPLNSLSQLNQLTLKVRDLLEKGVKISDDTEFQIIQSLAENTVDPLSTVLIRYGLTAKTEVLFFDSKRHIPIVPFNDFTEKDRKTMDEIYQGVYRFISP